MAAFDYFGNMYDVALKPRLLRTLVRDHLPDEKRPFSNPSELSRVISLIKTHRLLSESVTESMDPKLVEAWKSAVASWIDRILTLISSTMPDKCWAGISLLGLTCEHCGSDRFLESYSVWFQKLLSFLQSPVDSCLMTVASCASVADLFARLSKFPQLKKDGSSCAVKVIQPVLKMLHDNNSEAICEGALHVLCTIITSFPFSIQRYYDHVESAIALKLQSGGCSPSMLKKLAHCLALLPKSKGDEESWSMMIQKILLAINDQLNFAFQGLEEETMRKKVIRLLVLPGKQTLPLGGYIWGEEASNKATKRSEQLLLSNVSTLMFGCCMMLTNSYPVKVKAPVQQLLALVERILMVNGSLPQMSLPFMTAKQQENSCSELPFLHLGSLELLSAIIKAMGSQLLPHAASIIRIITKYFKTCALPELRIKVYSITKTLLISMGVGMAIYLAQEVVHNAVADLSTIDNKSGVSLNGLNSNASTGALLSPSHRKRKHSSTTGSLQEPEEGGILGVEVPKNHPLTPISLRIAALEALEALITVDGALRSEKWRFKVDNLLIVIAMDSFKEGSTSEEIGFLQQNEPAATAADLQLAAFHALLASFLSFSRVRPPYLAQGLELFRRGKQQTGTKLAEFCAHALLTLEVLIHPRALPMVDYVYANDNSYGEAQCDFRDEYMRRNNSTPFGLLQTGHDDTFDPDDYLCVRWMENDDEANVSLPKNTKHTEEPAEACKDDDLKVHSVHQSSDSKIQERREMVSDVGTCPDAEMIAIEDEIILKSDQPGESVVQCQEPISSTTSIPGTEACGSVATESVSERIVLDGTVPHGEDTHMELGGGTSVNKAFELASQSNSLQQTSGSNMIHEFAFKWDHGSSVDDEDDPFPDIVDGDPDSD